MTDPSTHEPIATRVLKRINDTAVPLALLAYGAGVAIVNMSLGTIGVVSFEVVRLRYVLSGALFFFFVASVLFPLRLLDRTIAASTSLLSWKFLGGAASITFRTFGVLLYLTTAVGFLAGVDARIPPFYDEARGPTLGAWLLGLPRLAFLEIIPNIVLAVIALAVVAVLLVLVLYVVFVFVDRKEAVALLRPSSLRNALAHVGSRLTVRSILQTSFYCLLALFVLTALSAASSLLTYYSKETSGVAGGLTSIARHMFDRFLFGAMAVFSLMAVWLVAARSRVARKVFEDKYYTAAHEQRSGHHTFGAIQGVSVAASLVLPFYVLVVYPALPQQIGGGEAPFVRVSLAGEAHPAGSFGPEDLVRLVDRTAERLVLVVYESGTGRARVVEMPASLVATIEFKVFDVQDAAAASANGQASDTLQPDGACVADTTYASDQDCTPSDSRDACVYHQLATDAGPQ